MSIKDELSAELKDAMLKKDGPRRDVVRQVQSEVALAVTEPGFEGEPDDALYEKVIAGYVKKMAKSEEEYRGMGERGQAMADKLAFEVEYLGRWLPKKLDEDSTRDLVISKIAELGASGDEKAAGRVIGAVMKEHGDEVDGGLVNRLVRDEITS